MQTLKKIDSVQPDLVISMCFSLRSECSGTVVAVLFLQNRKNAHYRMANCIELTRFCVVADHAFITIRLRSISFHFIL